jgi:histidinol-phosphate aminotransferase
VLARAEGLPAHALAASMRDTEPVASGAPRVDTQFDSPPNARQSAAVRTRHAYQEIELYEPGRTPCEIDLSDNTNLHGVPPSARALLDGAATSLITRYPTVYGRELKAVLARRHRVMPDNIATGCGSDDILDSLLRAFCDAGDTVAFSAPTFGVIEMFARMNSARPVAVPHADSGQLDVPSLVRANASVTYVCNPNNPTGTLYDSGDIESLAASVPGILAIDEAYADYSGESALALAQTTGRTIIVKTLSKAFGLAGLRVGYAIGDAALIREVEKARGPYKVGALVEQAAIAALTRDGDWVSSHIREIRDNRERLAASLTECGLRPLPSRANFLLIPVRGAGTAQRWHDLLRQRGIAVRAFHGLAGLGDAIRVTIGPWPLMERFVNAVRAIQDSDTPVETAAL